MRKVISMLLVIALCVSFFSAFAIDYSFGFGQNATVETGTVFDEKGIRIDIVDLEYSSYETTLIVNVANNTSSEINILSGAVGYSVYSINGYMIGGGYVNKDIEPNESVEVEIDFDNDDLELYGIKEIASIEFGFRIEDSKSNYLYTGPIKIYTSAHDGFDYSRNTYREYITSASFTRSYGVKKIMFHEENLLETSDVEIVSWGIFRNTYDELVLIMEIVNESDETANLSGTDLCINGLKIYAGTVCYETMNPETTVAYIMNLSYLIDTEFAEMLGVEEIRNISFTAQVYNDDYVEISKPKHIMFPIKDDLVSYDASGVELYNKNGIRIIYKAIYDAVSEYDDNIYALFLIENKSGKNIELDDRYVYANGERVTTTCFNYVPSGFNSVAELELYSYSFSEFDIESVDDIKTLSAEFRINDDRYRTVDTFTVDIPLE